MSNFLTRIIFRVSILILFISMFSNAAHAQCTVSKTKTTNGEWHETEESYEYARTAKAYFALSVKTRLLVTNADSSYKLALIYTGSPNVINPTSLTFKLANGTAETALLKFIKKQDTDNENQVSKYFEVSLTRKQAANLKLNALNNVVIGFKTLAPVALPIKDKTILQTQLTCLDRQN